MNRYITGLFLACFLSLACFFGGDKENIALAQTPCQWNYSFVNGIATATYCSSIAYPGTVTAPPVVIAKDDFSGNTGGPWTGRNLQVGGTWTVSGATGTTTENVGGGLALGNNLGIYHLYTITGVSNPWHFRIGITKTSYSTNSDHLIYIGGSNITQTPANGIHVEIPMSPATPSFAPKIWYGDTCTVSTSGSSTTITVTGCTYGNIAVPATLATGQIGATLSGASITGSPTIVSQTSGTTGGNGVYVISAAQTLTAATVNFEAAGRTLQVNTSTTCPTLTGSDGPYFLDGYWGRSNNAYTGSLTMILTNNAGKAMCNYNGYDPLIARLENTGNTVGYLQGGTGGTTVEEYTYFEIDAHNPSATSSQLTGIIGDLSGGSLGTSFPVDIASTASFHMGTPTITNNAFSANYSGSFSSELGYPAFVNDTGPGGLTIAAPSAGQASNLFLNNGGGVTSTLGLDGADITYLLDGRTSGTGTGGTRFLQHNFIGYDITWFSGLVGIGGNTASFPALSNSGTIMQDVLADGSGTLAPHRASGYYAGASAGITETCTVTPTGLTIVGGIITAKTGGTCSP